MYFKYIVNVFCVSFLFLASCLLFVLIVDPLGMSRIIVIPGFNANKIERSPYERIFKVYDVSRIRPKVVCIGTSRCQYGLEMNNSIFGNFKVYNLGISGANITELNACFLNHNHALINLPGG